MRESSGKLQHRHHSCNTRSLFLAVCGFAVVLLRLRFDARNVRSKGGLSADEQEWSLQVAEEVHLFDLDAETVAAKTLSSIDSEGPSDEQISAARDLRFYMLPVPEVTDWIIGNYTAIAWDYYANTLNEHAAEIWLHRGFLNTTLLVDDPYDADVVLVPSYLQLNLHIQTMIATNATASKMNHIQVPSKLAELLIRSIEPFYNASQHRIVVLMTCQNPIEGLQTGVRPVIDALAKRFGDNVYSLGFERNKYWQSVNPDHIIVIPYVVKPVNRSTEHVFAFDKRGVFYRGDIRKHAVQWAGCNRSMILPLMEYGQHSENLEGVNVELVSKGARLSQTEYNTMIEHSEFCLAICGDTPTSRSLASYMVAGCIPLRVGSRLRGYCDEPCHPGWGWTVTNGSAHLPYESFIDWSKFPEVDENKFVEDPVREIRDVLNTEAHRTE